MYAFTAHFIDNDVYLDGARRFSTNEVLVELLNMPVEKFAEKRKALEKLQRRLVLHDEMNDIDEYNDYAQKAQRLMHAVDAVFRNVSISKFMTTLDKLNADRLFDLLNTVGWVWADRQYMNDAPPSDDNEFGLYLYEDDDYGNDHYFYNTVFYPEGLDIKLDEYDMIADLEEFNKNLTELFESYYTFIDDILRVQEVYTDFVDNYLNAQSKYLDKNQLAEAFLAFIKKHSDPLSPPHRRFTSGYSSFTHSVLKDKDGKNILCQSYHFKSLGAFLYFDLFRGIETNYIPKRCNNCGKYFLIAAGKYSDYCERTSPQDSTKTCREVGARKRYDEKCKTDPIWLTYNRAYKAHYARYMKKKMTTAEFERWSAWAVEIRTKAENGEIEFEEYRAEIRK